MWEFDLYIFLSPEIEIRMTPIDYSKETVEQVEFESTGQFLKYKGRVASFLMNLGSLKHHFSGQFCPSNEVSKNG
jgi:hypothetical protein